jgi:hypothetical protein
MNPETRCEYPLLAAGQQAWCPEYAAFAVFTGWPPGMVTFYCRAHTLGALQLLRQVSQVVGEFPPGLRGVG